MSTANSGLETTARERLIPPPGNCVTGLEAPTFTRLDEGVPNPQDIEIGKAACGNCLHLAICHPNRHAIGVQLAKLTQSGSVFVGGEQIDTQPNDIRPRVIDEVVPFSLKELPPDPNASLTFLRQGVRRGVFRPGGHTPAAVATLTHRFLIELRGTDNELYTKLASNILTESRVRKGVQDITAVLFQHADYDNAAQGRKSKHRYSAGRLDPQAHHEIAAAFCKDVVTLADKKFTRPERQALYYGPEDYQKLITQYADEICPTDLHYIFQHSMRDPETELRERLARLRILREAHYGTNIPDSVLQQRARWQLGDDPTEGIKKRPSPIRPTVATAEAVTTSRVQESPGEEDTQKELTGPELTIQILHEAYGDDAILTRDTFIRLSHLPPAEALQRCSELKQSTAQALEDRDKQPLHRFLGDGVIHKIISRSGGYKNYTTLYREAEIYNAGARFRQRKLKGIGPPAPHDAPPRWALDLVSTQTNDYTFRATAERLYDMYSVKGLATPGIAELTLLQDKDYHTQLKSICHHRYGKYVAFAPGLSRLDPLDRLTLAAYHGLDKLMYGQEIDQGRLARILETNDFDSYATEIVLPRAMELKNEGHGIPVTIMRLSKDLDIYKCDIIGPHELPTEDITTVIGGVAMQIGPSSIELDIDLEDGARQWLSSLIFNRCGGQHEEMTPDIEKAIWDNILVISTVNGGYHIGFHPLFHERGDEQSLGALAHVLGIDTFLYGCNLKSILKARLETSIGAAAQQLAETVRELRAETPYSPCEIEPEVESKQDPAEEASELAAVELEDVGEDAPLGIAKVTPKEDILDETEPQVVPYQDPSIDEWLSDVAHKASRGKDPAATESLIKESMVANEFRIGKDGSGAKAFVIPRTTRDKLPAAILISRAKELGIYAHLDQGERSALETEVKLFDRLTIHFPAALSALVHIGAAGLATGHRNRFSSIFLHHMGLSRERVELTAGDKRLFEQGMRQIANAYQQYVGSDKSFSGMRRPTRHTNTLAVLHKVLASNPRSRQNMRVAVQLLPLTVPEEGRRYAHQNCQVELINFSRWAAFHLQQ